MHREPGRRMRRPDGGAHARPTNSTRPAAAGWHSAEARVGSVTHEEFLETQFPSLTGWIRGAAAAAAGSRVHELDGVVAQVSPAIPDRSLFNSVTYSHVAALRAALPELEAVYADAGVRAWTVWVHES